MQRRAARVRLAAAILLGLAGQGCSCGETAAGWDAGPDGDGGAGRDAAARPDANAPLIWIDFSVAGCDAALTAGAAGPDGVAGPRVDGGPGDDAAPDDAGVGQVGCVGAAPLRLSFIPVAPAAVELHEWSFGDGSDPDRRAAPDHVYAEPGAYDVSLFVQGPGGTAAVIRPGFVQVVPAGGGRACSSDSQCATGVCVCGAAPCDGLGSGFCSAACSASAPCGAADVCVDLAAGGPGPAPVPAWRDQLCLPSCGQGEACPAGSECRELPAEAGGWAAACFAPGLLGDVGDPCADPDGQLDGSRCASGTCLAIGLRGACSAACDEGACPGGAACATFAGGEPAPSCVARCGDEQACDGDPWLACEAPGGAGDLAFTVDEQPAEGGYCAPRACGRDDECAPGRCAGGYCGP